MFGHITGVFPLFLKHLFILKHKLPQNTVEVVFYLLNRPALAVQKNHPR